VAHITKPHGDFSTGAIPPDKVNDQMDTVYNEFNGGINADNIENDSLTDNEIATAIKPVLRYKECFQDHSYSGLTMSYSGLEATIAAGTAYVDGVRVEADSETHTCNTSSTTYLDLSAAGTYSWNSNANPADDATRLYTIITDDTEITPAPTDTRTLAPVNYSEIEADACTKVYSAKNTTTDATTTATTYVTCLDAGTVDVKEGDELVMHGIAVMKESNVSIGYLAIAVDGTEQDIKSGNYFETATKDYPIKAEAIYSVAADNPALPITMTFKTVDTAITLTAGHRLLTIVRHRR